MHEKLKRDRKSISQSTGVVKMLLFAYPGTSKIFMQNEYGVVYNKLQCHEINNAVYFVAK